MPHVISEKAEFSVSANRVAPDLQQLRHLLFGKDYQELLALKNQLDNPELYSEKVAGVVSEALALRLAQDESLAEVLSPTVEGALTDSVERDPERLANALYPVMGPAIRKSINEVLSHTFETFNHLLEQSLSPKSLLWRLDAWRTGRSYPEVVLLKTLEFQVEQVFLIHRESGLLLRHAVLDQAISNDPDMVSGMLTAIQDFITDSFGIKEGESLSRLRLGELTVLVDQGPHAVIAAVIRGNPPGSMAGLLKQTQEDVHRQMTNTLMRYEGDSEPFVRIHPLLEKCLLVQTQEKEKRKPWLLYLFMSALLAGLAYWGYLKYQASEIERVNELQWQAAVEKMDAEPGVVVIEAQREGHNKSIRGLLDPLAEHPESFLDDNTGSETVYSFTPYLSAEPGIVIRRVYHVLQPPENVGLVLNNGVLQVSGNVDSAWRDRLDQLWPNIVGINALDDSRLTVNEDAKKQQLLQQQQRLKQQQQNLIRQIQAVRHYFRRSRIDTVENDPQLVAQAQRIKQLMALAKQQRQVLQISIVGNADQLGNQKNNGKLANQRALNVYQRLVSLGVPDYILLVPGKNLVGMQPEPDKQRNERSVHYLINLY